MSHPQLSIVIPAYNESARIENALERVMSCVQEQGWDAEVLVVDDGSKDNTAAIVQQWIASNSGRVDDACRTHLQHVVANDNASISNGLKKLFGIRE